MDYQDNNHDEYETRADSDYYIRNEDDEYESSGDDSEDSQENETQIPNSQLTKITINRTSSSHKRCVVCSRKNKKLKRIPRTAVLNCYLRTNIFVPFGTRACHSHFNDYSHLKDEAVMSLKIYSNNINLNPDHVKMVFEFLRLAALKNTLFDRFYSIDSIDDELCLNITGIKFILYC